MNFNIHLNGRDSLMGSANLKVHVSEEVFQSLDIRQNKVIIVCLSGHQSAGNSGHHALDGHACRHQGQRGSTDAGLGSGTVGFHGLGYGTDCVGEFLFAGKYRNKSTLCKGAMADFPASRSSGRLCLTDGEGRKVIMVHIPFAGFILIQPVQALCLG